MADSSITKKALASAVKELMRTRPLNKISVGDICDKCGMNRKSFYYHFRDKYDLINWVFYTEFVEQLLEKGPDDFLESICTYFYRNRDFYVSALEQTGQNSFTEYFYEVMTPLLRIHFADLLRDEQEDHEFYATFYTDAFLSAVRRWLREDSMPPERFTRLIRRATELPGLLRGSGTPAESAVK